MRKILRMAVALLMLVSLPGCTDRIDLEDATLSLMIGLDLSEKNDLIFYVSSPVFSREAQAKSEEFGVKAHSLRESRQRFDELVSGLTLSGKVQLFVLGRRLLDTPDWFQLMDVVYRDARFSVNARMIVYDGPLEELFHMRSKTKPRVALHLMKLVDTANRRNITVKTTAQELHRQMYEKGLTPTITKLDKATTVQVEGTALLTETGKFATVISSRETSFLQMLLQGRRGEISISLPYPDSTEKEKIVKKRVSFFVKGLSKKVKTSFVDGKFQFDVDLKLRTSISERLFPFDMDKDYKKMETMLEKEFQREYQELFQKCQQLKIDPFGFGLHARAYQYEAWKKVQNEWTQAFSQAKINITPHVDIKGNGNIR
ncbi:Ger(x)C family spore germination protein [Brevibacillus nitrificans]|uniref:Ger(x)C family spore germination protein n=1 Tax=Brevibacillus nitrificans TaxID=651560 RepID=UPI002862CA4A|nr:Ger(x)C family spore germination protein [Brevibacillus nitrificans]MDR7318146.1 Ger(x)C family germination protein [Brevibacillus nitrificans]